MVVSFVAGANFSLHQITEAMEHITRHYSKNGEAEIIFGVTVDASYGNTFEAMLIATRVPHHQKEPLIYGTPSGVIPPRGRNILPQQVAESTDIPAYLRQDDSLLSEDSAYRISGTITH